MHNKSTFLKHSTQIFKKEGKIIPRFLDTSFLALLDQQKLLSSIKQVFPSCEVFYTTCDQQQISPILISMV